MRKIPFELDQYTPDKKVVTGEGFEVQILTTEAFGVYPVVGRVIMKETDRIDRFDKKGFRWGVFAQNDNLYFAEEGDELTEFERAVGVELTNAHRMPDANGKANIHELNEFIRKVAARILSAAEKEIMQTGSILPADTIEVNSFHAGYKQGKDEAQKYSPRWKTHHGVDVRADYGAFMVIKNPPVVFCFTKVLHEGDVYLTEDDLTNLPKEE